ncbi:hypothetical protein TrVE_jg11528 [Triparma verrucosa]|uniref:Uncharacterized protein n=1 Tax=Triparma verrucosa TaxID=1606542 RepID=A0A9W7CGL0_9STRA|nr:hypothetical protein TrVE_jg11528 [Triparma verrucosa]
MAPRYGSCHGGDFDDSSRCLASKCTSVEDRPPERREGACRGGYGCGGGGGGAVCPVRSLLFRLSLLGYDSDEGNGNVVASAAPAKKKKAGPSGGEGKKEGEVPVEIPAALLFMRYLKNL